MKKDDGVFCYRFPDWLNQRIRDRAKPSDTKLNEELKPVIDDAAIRRRLIVAGAEALANRSAPKIDPKIFRESGRPKLVRFDVEGAEVGLYRAEGNKGRISLAVSDIDSISWEEVVQLFKELAPKKVSCTAMISLNGEAGKIRKTIESIRKRREDDSSLLRRCLYTGLILEEKAAGIQHEE